MHKYLNLVTKFLEVLTITLSLCCISSCKKEKGGYLDDAIAIAYKDDIPYLVNSKNQTFSLAEYDLIVPYFDDILIVQKNGLFGYIRKNGQVLLEPQYDEAYPFSEEKAVVRKNGTSFIINYAGKVLYTLENNYSSISSFSNNLLVISSSDSQGYLQYNPDIDGFQYLFNILETNEKGQTIVNHLPYDYCGKFTNNYAVVGFYNDNGEYKYSHINLKGNRLYDYEWDYASDFSNGYAVVGNTDVYKLKVYCDKERQFDSVIRENNNYRPLSDELSPKLTNMTYMYISTTGKYLGETSINQYTGEVTIQPYVFAQASTFKNSLAIVSDLCLLVDNFSYYGQNYKGTSYFNNYAAIDTNGNRILASPMGYKNYWGKGIICSYNDIVYVDGIYILSYHSYEYQTLYYDDVESAIGSFSNVPVKINKDEYWIDGYIKDFTNGKVQPEYVIDHAIPYNQSLFKMSKYINSYVAKTQISSGFKDSSGLIQLSIVDSSPVITYIIPPVYDNIIF